MAKSEQFQLIDLKLPSLDDQSIKTEVQKTQEENYSLLCRHPLLLSIRHVLKPTTNFVDSTLLNKKESANGVELEAENILELNSTLSELDALAGGHGFSTRILLERKEPNIRIGLTNTKLLEFSRISELKTLGRDDYFMFPALLMDKTANIALQSFDEIDLQVASMDLHKFQSCLSWDAKAINIMGCFVFKFLEFLGFLLHGPNHPIIEMVSSMEALKENPVSLVGTPLEKILVPLEQLNNLIKLTLEVIEYISELMLLSDTEDSNEDLLSTSAHWAILSVLACYIQITFFMQNGEVALELSHLISNLSMQILNDLKNHYTTCKLRIDEMEAHLQQIAFSEDAFRVKPLSNTPLKMSELMKSFLCSKDGCHALIDGSTKSKVDLDVLEEKAVVFLISGLDIHNRVLTHLKTVYEQLKEEDYYKIVWVPFVLKWTEELRKKFENLKSKMPWYVVSYDSPISGVWYIKGRLIFFKRKCSYAIIDLQHGNQFTDPVCFNSLYLYAAEHFPYKRMEIGGNDTLSLPPSHHLLYHKVHEEDVNEKKPSSGFQGLVAMSKSRGTLNPKQAKANPADASARHVHP